MPIPWSIRCNFLAFLSIFTSSRIVLEAAGIQNILAKRLGSNNLLNNAQATIDALKNLRTLKQIAKQRDLSLTHFYN